MAQQEPSEFPRDFKGNAYVALLQDREFMEEFVTHFVDLGAIGKTFSFEDADRLDRVYITERLREGGRDVLWKIPFSGGELVLVLLVEHQSTVDYSMPIRLFFYAAAISEEHYKAAPEAERRAQAFRLPPVVPVLFYTGEDRWTAARSLREKILYGE